MSFRDLKIGDGKKYDLSEVSSEGISKEERAALEKKNNKLIDIFKAFDLDGDGGLNKLELAMAMDAFSALDTDGGKDGKLSKKELEKGAEYFNEAFKELGVNVEGKDLKAFIKSVFKATKGDKKESTESIIHEYDTQLAQQEALAKLEKEQAEAKAKAEAEAKAKAEAEAKAKAEAEAQAAAEKQRLATPTNYTVQPGEKLEDLLKRSLEAQGKEVNEESLAEAKAEFIKNNPNALHGKKGKEYLYMGDVVKIAGALEDKGNADEIKADYRAGLAEKRETEAPARQNTGGSQGTVADEAAKAAGYSKTSNAAYYKDAAGNHYKYENGKFVLQKGLVYVGADGTTRTEDKVAANTNSSILRDKNGRIKSMKLVTDDNKVYANKDHVAKNLGLRKTAHGNTYYDAKTKTHYAWNANDKTFTPLNGVKSVAANGMQFDNKGNSISPKGYRMMTDGSVKKSYSGDQLNSYNDYMKKLGYNGSQKIDVEYKFYSNGRVKSLLVIQTKPDGSVSRGVIDYPNVEPGKNGTVPHSVNIAGLGALGIVTDKPYMLP